MLKKPIFLVSVDRKEIAKSAHAAIWVAFERMKTGISLIMTRLWHGIYAQRLPGTPSPRATVMSSNLPGRDRVRQGEHRLSQAPRLPPRGPAFPGSIHHASFPSVVLEPWPTYTQTTVYRFLAR